MNSIKDKSILKIIRMVRPRPAGPQTEKITSTVRPECFCAAKMYRRMSPLEHI
jgi:hypothetical protein